MNDSDIRAALAPFKVENRLDGVHVQDGLVQVSLTATRDEAAGLEPLRRDIEAALRDMPGVKSATVIFSISIAATWPRTSTSTAFMIQLL